MFFLLFFILISFDFAHLFIVDLEREAIQTAIQIILDYDFIRSPIPH